ncbi:MAG TPA: NAD-dependent epimerase/dehydratase family protein [Kiritimatiellia bacterium]|nr:NAD-dependent epimerase/dehydratase family protein [Kiritimatiellia bacterium]HRZ13326.1 NAD-dependent epimerase/dehydratase family protein [Kiritimatiellia bacterium]HSA18775.1 NAD-dependent epimerase/dehydratase family protein [Kiritimatiellia bacterium]
MSRCLVTGAAGFIGSHLCDALLDQGHDVVGLDAFIPYYPRAVKEANLAGARRHPRFTFHELDLRTADLAGAVSGCEVVFHEAAMPGLMRSWSDLDLYASCNLVGTQRLLEAARQARVAHVIHVSTSSVYGREATGPEDSALQPCSPYGITKLGAEHLCRTYAGHFGVPVTILRYFSVYGPRQRPDMAYHILIRCLLRNEPFTLYGAGDQTRSNTYAADCVQATLLAMAQRERALGGTFNVGGGQVVSLNEVIALLEELTGRRLDIRRKPARPGDQKHTAADITRIASVLSYQPSTPVREGLQAQLAWERQILSAT